jgi:raffinose/stachyose/melibiose transport system substrate-binding protein
MKKALILLAILVLPAAFVFAGGKQEEAAGTGPITLSMYEYEDLTGPEAGNWEIMLNTFYASHPDVKLEIEYGFEEPYHNKLQAMSVAGQLPDIMFLWPLKRTGEITGSGQIKDLSPWIKGHEGEFVEGALAPQGLKPTDKVYELPEQMTSTHVMYTNNKLLKDFGLNFPNTMDELLAQGDKIRGAGLIPIAMANKAGWQMQSCFLSTLTERAGGMKWFRNAVDGNGASFTDPEFIQALSIIDTLAKKEMFSPGLNQTAYGQGVTDFANEQAVYHIDGGWRVNAYVIELTAEQKEYVSLETFPDIPNQKGKSGSTAVVVGTGYGMNEKLEGAKADAAWDWIWYYSGPVGSAIRQGFGAIPAYKLPIPANVDPMIKKLIEFWEGRPSGYVIDAVLDGEGMGVLHPALQEMILGAKTPQQVAEEYEAWVAANDSARK